MMRILAGNIPLPGNRFIVDLNAALGGRHNLLHDHHRFWNCEGDFDVVHLHFPEYLTEEIKKAYFEDSLDERLLKKIEKRMEYWASRSRVIFTRHNLFPLLLPGDHLWERLYEMVYGYAHGIVHFAQPSVDEFKRRYAKTAFFHGPPEHTVIPHHNYLSLPNEISRSEARRRLGVPASAHVLLVFGGIRKDAERELILNTFQTIRDRDKFLLISRWPEKLVDFSWIRLKYWLRDLARLYYRLHPRFRMNYNFVPEEDAQQYLNAADVLFIPRLKVLNSGNVTLGMTFGKVVVGPDSLDVGHLLRKTGNVVFDPERPETAGAAVERAFALVDEGEIGPKNRRLALSEWSVDQCAELYAKFFNQLATEGASG